MIDDELVLLAGLVFATFVLMSGAPPGHSRGFAVPLITQAQFEEEIEAGFGRVDRVPADWAFMPLP